MSSFQGITIISMDVEASSCPNPSEALYNIVLILSDSAPDEWAKYFNDKWKQHLYMMKREASVSKKSLTINCVPEELEKNHIPELKIVIEETNKKYKEYLAKQQVSEEKRKQDEKAEKEKLSNLKNTIKFD